MLLQKTIINDNSWILVYSNKIIEIFLELLEKTYNNKKKNINFKFKK